MLPLAHFEVTYDDHRCWGSGSFKGAKGEPRTRSKKVKVQKWVPVWRRSTFKVGFNSRFRCISSFRCFRVFRILNADVRNLLGVVWSHWHKWRRLGRHRQIIDGWLWSPIQSNSCIVLRTDCTSIRCVQPYYRYPIFTIAGVTRQTTCRVFRSFGRKILRRRNEPKSHPVGAPVAKPWDVIFIHSRFAAHNRPHQSPLESPLPELVLSEPSSPRFGLCWAQTGPSWAMSIPFFT